MKIFLRSLCVAVLFSVTACSTQSETESPSAVLALIHQADSMSNIPAIKGSLVVPSDFDSYEIKYTLSEKTEDLVYYTADGIDYFCAANGKLGFTRDTLEMVDSLIIQELFFQDDKPFYSRRIDAKSNKILKQLFITELEGDGSFFTPDYVLQRIKDNVITLESLRGVWIDLIRKETDEGEVLTIPCGAGGLEITNASVTLITQSGYERTNGIDSSYSEGGSLLLFIQRIGGLKFSPYKRGIVSYGIVDCEGGSLLFRKSIRNDLALVEEPCDAIVEGDTVATDSTTSNE
jgi:hypothetical protein